MRIPRPLIFVLFGLALLPFPLLAAPDWKPEKGNVVEELQYLAMSGEDPAKIWKYYEDHKAVIDDLLDPQKPIKVPKGRSGSADYDRRVYIGFIQMGLQGLIAAAVILERPETESLINRFEAAAGRPEFTMGMFALDTQVIPLLCDVGDFKLAADLVARNRARSRASLEKTFSGAQDSPAAAKLMTEVIPLLPYAAFHEAMGDWSGAEQVLQAQLKMIKFNCESSPETAETIYGSEALMLPSSAAIKYRSGKIEDAKKALGRYFELEDDLVERFRRDWNDDPVIREQISAPHRLRARLISSRIALDEGRWDDARKWLAEAEPFMAACEKLSEPLRSNPNHTARGMSYQIRIDYSETRIRMALADRKFDDAVTEARSLATLTEKLPEQSPARLAIRQQLAWTLLEAGKTDEARVLIDSFKQVQLKQLRGLFASGSERQKLIFLQHAEPYSLFAATGNAEELADLMVKVKGSVLDSLIAGRRALVAAKTPEERLLLERLKEAGRALTKSLFTGDGELEQRQRAWEQLQAQVSKNSRENAGNALEASVASVVARLNPQEALCDFIRYRVLDGKGSWSPQYGAIILRPQRPPVWVPLGSAAEIDLKIARILEGQAALLKEAELKLLLKDTYRALVTPLLPAIEGCGRLVISPDSALTQLSFSVLLDDQESFLAETRQLVYVTHARDLLAPEPAAWESGGALIVSDPDFTAAPATKLKKVEREQLLAALPFDVSDLPSVARLESTRDEATRISHTLEGMGCKVSILSGGEAREKAMAPKLSDGPALLHFATHGYVLPASRMTMSRLSATGLLKDLGSDRMPVIKAPEVPMMSPGGAIPPGTGARLPGAGAPQPGEGPAPLLVDQPLERSMLALASAKSTFAAWEGQQLAAPEDDGLLTAAEIAALPMDSVYLTALSACDTATGDPVAGEGVMGLRRGFFMAGSKHLLVTFWSLDDESAPETMNEFYRELRGTRHPALALGNVQGRLFKTLRENGTSFPRMVFIAGAFGVSSTGKLPK